MNKLLCMSVNMSVEKSLMFVQKAERKKSTKVLTVCGSKQCINMKGHSAPLN